MALFKLYANGVDVSEYMIDQLKESGDLGVEDNGFMLGATPCRKIEVSLDNSDGSLTTYITNLATIWTLYQDTTLYMTLTQSEAPTDYFGTVSITLYDNMLKANVAYESTLDFGLTGLTGLAYWNDVLSVAGMTCDTDISTLLNAYIPTINTYDNSVSCRDNIRWISECLGMNCYITPAGHLALKVLTGQTAVAHDDASKYKGGNQFTIGGVEFNNGTIVYDSDTKTGNLLYVSSNNPFVTQDIVNYLYGIYNGFTAYSLDNIEFSDTPTVALGNRISFNGTEHLVLKYDATWSGGEYYLYEVSGTLLTANQEAAVASYTNDMKIRKVQSIIDTQAGTISQISALVTNNQASIGVLTTGYDHVTASVSKLEDEVNGVLTNYQSELESGSIDTTGTAVASTTRVRTGSHAVDSLQTYYLTTDTDKYIYSITQYDSDGNMISQMTPSKTYAIGFTTNSKTATIRVVYRYPDDSTITTANVKVASIDIASISTKVDVQAEQLYILQTNAEDQESYIRYQNGTVEIGKTGDSTALDLTNDKLAFVVGGTVVAYLAPTYFSVSAIEVPPLKAVRSDFTESVSVDGSTVSVHHQGVAIVSVLGGD